MRGVHVCVCVIQLLESLRQEMLMMSKFEAMKSSERTSGSVADYFAAVRKHGSSRAELARHFTSLLDKYETAK